ncbi:hypothetical protein HK096_003917, partial [Nowakowskiella sp. JEL0078]
MENICFYGNKSVAACTTCHKTDATELFFWLTSSLCQCADIFLLFRDNGNEYKSTNNTVPPSPPYYQGRFSNGKVWNEHVAISLGLTIDNRAVGGALVGDLSLISNISGTAQQVQSWLKNLGSEDFSTLLVSYWAGGNDVISGIISQLVGIQFNATKVALNERMILEQIIKAGVKHLTVFNLPAIDFLATLGGKYNDALSSQLSDLAKTYPDVYFYEVDVVAIYNTIKNGDYGIWDIIHPTARVHCEIAKAVGTIVGISDGGIVCNGTATSAAGKARFQ